MTNYSDFSNASAAVSRNDVIVESPSNEGIIYGSENVNNEDSNVADNVNEVDNCIHGFIDSENMSSVDIECNAIFEST